jgi:Na+-translocating ferredoxin:NAD+ oxidoreductase RnfD subunit
MRLAIRRIAIGVNLVVTTYWAFVVIHTVISRTAFELLSSGALFWAFFMAPAIMTLSVLMRKAGSVKRMIAIGLNLIIAVWWAWTVRASIADKLFWSLFVLPPLVGAISLVLTDNTDDPV